MIFFWTLVTLFTKLKNPESRIFKIRIPGPTFLAEPRPGPVNPDFQKQKFHEKFFFMSHIHTQKINYHKNFHTKIRNFFIFIS